jgi:hypothetical protein
VDHVVTYAFWRGFGPKGGDRITVWRHGAIVRQVTEYIGSKRDADPRSETIYSNFATGASISGTERGPDEPMGYTFWRENAKSRMQYRYELVRTAETKIFAGEHCTMWRADPLGERGGVFTGVPRRACITGDGVVLYDAWLYSSGGVAEERTAVRVERRRVAPKEVLPPKDALDWARWMVRAKTLEPKPTGRPANYDLTLTRNIPKLIDWDGGADRIRNRASDGWMLAESWNRGQRRSFLLRHSSGGLSLSVAETLSISYYPKPKTPIWNNAVALKGAPRKVLGETCSGFNAAPNVSDYWRTECRSADGLPLIVDEDSWGNPAPTLTAVSLTRGKTRLRDLMPPAGMLNWTEWGWPELAR